MVEKIEVIFTKCDRVNERKEYNEREEEEENKK